MDRGAGIRPDRRVSRRAGTLFRCDRQAVGEEVTPAVAPMYETTNLSWFSTGMLYRQPASSSRQRPYS